MKDFLTILNTYKGYIGLLFGIGSFVFAYGVKSATREISSKSSDVRIERWIEYDSISHIDSQDFQRQIFIRLDGISDTNKLIYLKQTKTIGSVDAIAGKVSGSIEEYKKIMNGLQFELVQSEVMRSVFPETKIKIIKK
jgi:hypothetical protein